MSESIGRLNMSHPNSPHSMPIPFRRRKVCLNTYCTEDAMTHEPWCEDCEAYLSNHMARQGFNVIDRTEDGGIVLTHPEHEGQWVYKPQWVRGGEVNGGEWNKVKR